MRPEGAVILEIGTGWESINALLIHLVGAKVGCSYQYIPHVSFKLAKVTPKGCGKTVL
jgi:hypothetical protein